MPCANRTKTKRQVIVSVIALRHVDSIFEFEATFYSSRATFSHDHICVYIYPRQVPAAVWKVLVSDVRLPVRTVAS